MDRWTRLTLLLCGLAAGAAPAAAQDFQPPDAAVAGSSSGMRIDLLGFTTRAGIDLSRGGAFVVGSTVDIAQLGSPQVRLRPSFEYSGSGATTAVHVSTEVIYRFQSDRAPAIPYVGLGLGYYAPSEGSERLWLNVVMGFELEFRPSFNWLLEYHALDRLGRHRFLVGLATRGSY